MSLLPENVLFVRVSYKWYQVIKAHYIISGSSAVNCWFADPANKLPFENEASGSLVLLVVNRDDNEYIVGGGFYIGQASLPIEKAWSIFGVRTGALDFNDFKNQIKELRPNAKNINCIDLTSSFLFSRNECELIPEEVSDDFKGKDTLILTKTDPLGRYLAKTIFAKRALQLREGKNNDWPGIFQMASQRKSIQYAATFNAQLMQAYDFKCAITGSTAKPVLDAAHIKTLYDDNFHDISNGILLRSDLHQLFSQGYITAIYVSDNEVKVIVSQTVKEVAADEYLKYDGQNLSLPKDKKLWPSKEYLEWHKENRFENWLKFGEIKPVDVTKSA